MIQYKPWSDEIVKSMAQQACEGIFTCLDIELGGECPYNCIYCESPDRNKKFSLDMDKVCAFLDTKQFKWIYICGMGEPTYGYNEQCLLRLLESCKKNDVKCSIFTNLSNLSEQIQSYIRDGILHCVFKFDSQSVEVVKKLYNPVNVEQHVTNVKMMETLVICDGKTTNIAASIVPTKCDINEIPDLIQWCLERNIFPLVAQLEYTGAAKDTYDDLVLDDKTLAELKEKINQQIGEEYRVPFCPAVFAGISITYDNKIVVDRRTGLSCHSFWLDDPDLDVVCSSISDLLTVKDITYGMIRARAERFGDFVKNREIYKYDILGGCGGNRKDIFDVYCSMMKASFCPEPSNERYLRINRFIYFDNNATTKVSDSVMNAMIPYLKTYFANPNSHSQIGQAVRRVINHARAQIARVLNAEENEIYFTSGGSEGNSWAIKSGLGRDVKHEKAIILSTAIEHESILKNMEMLSRTGYEIINIPVTSRGDVNINLFLNTFSRWQEVAFASVMLVNNETGVINDIKKLAHIFNEYHIPMHCDAVQAVGKIMIDVKNLGIDYLSFSGHKIHAPKGIGALYVRAGSHLAPLIFGNQEKGQRGGTENAAFIVALGQAVEDAYSKRGTSFEERIRTMEAYRDKIEAFFSESNYKSVVNGKGAARVSNTLNIGFEGVDAVRLSLLLESRGIHVSNGAACNIVNPKQSHVLKAMCSPIYDDGAIRISLSEDTEERDVDYFIANLKESIKRVRGD